MTDPWELGLSLVGMGILVLGSFFFSVTETALMACDRLTIRRLAQEGNWRARMALELLERPERLLSTVQIGDKIVDAAFASLMTYWMVRILGQHPEVVIYAAFIIAAVTLLIGEIIPKTLGAYHPERMTLWMGPFLYLMMLAMYPLVRLVSGTARWTLHKFARTETARSEQLTEEDVRLIFRMLHKSAPYLRGMSRVATRILDLPNHPVSEIMIPRHRVVSIMLGTPIDEIARMVHTRGFSRYPVYADHPDNVVGILYVKDFWPALLDQRLHRPEDIRPMLRRPIVVHTNARIDQVLQEMRQQKMHIACVFDEFGRFEGIVTLEDIIEEIVGEIEDEFDIHREPSIHRRREGFWEVAGDVPVKELNEILPVPLPESHEYATLAGFLIHHLERIPDTGETVDYPPYRLVVRERDGPRIRRVDIVLRSERDVLQGKEQ